MVNSENLGVPIRVNAGSDLRRPEHDIGMSVRVDRITVAADVVGCVVHRELAN